MSEAESASVMHPNGRAGLLLPPLAVMLVGGLLGLLVLRSGSTVPGGTDPLLQSVQSVAGLGELRPPVRISPAFRPEVQYWAAAIVGWAGAAGLDPDLAAVVMQIESCGDPAATSRSGAMGLFQVMPFHFAANEDPYEPGSNAKRGLAYLAQSLHAAAGNPRLALAGYNGGIGVISWDEDAWSPQTKRYVRYGAAIYEDIQSGSGGSPALQEWYSAFGVGLCRVAADRLGIRQ